MMQLLVQTFYWGLIAIILFGLIMFNRIEWVYKVRTQLFKDDKEKYHRLPPYEEMWCKFWIWDVEKFLSKEDQSKEDQ